MKRIVIVLFCLAFFVTSFGQKNENSNEFKIKGIVTGFADSTLIYISDLSEGSYKDKDSAWIVEGKFQFVGSIPTTAVKFAIHTKDFSDRVAFWVENSQLVFKAEKGKLKNAVIKGSKTQIKKNELDSIISKSKNKKLDYIQFIQSNPQSIVSADLLNVYSSTWNKDTVSALYQQLSLEAKNSIYGKSVFEFLALIKSPKVGDMYVDFTQPTVDGKAIKLSDFQGKIVLLEFWGSWCVPCRQGHPELIRTYNEFKAKGFEIVGVAADNNKEFLMEAIQKDGLTWPNVSDLKGDRNKAALIYGVSYYPTNFLIGKNGIIIAKDVRGEKLREKLKEILHP